MKRQPTARRPIRRKYLAKLIAGYLAIFLLPVVLLAGWILQSALQEKRADIERNTLDKLGIAAQLVDQRLSFAQFVAFDVGANAYLRPANLQKSVSATLTGIEELKKYLRNDDFWEELYYWIDGEKTVYSAAGTTDAQIFLSAKLGLDAARGAAFEQALRDLEAARTFEIERGGEREIYYAIPVKRYDLNVRATVIFRMSGAECNRVLGGILAESGGACLLDDAGRVLGGLGAAGFSLDVRSLPEELWKGSGVRAISRSGVSYSAACVVTPKYGWRVLSILPERRFFQQAITMRSTVLWLLAVLCCLGALAAALLTFNSYRPIRRMTDLAPGSLTRPGSLDELDAVRMVLEDSMAANERLADEIEQNLGQLRQQTIKLLLGGFGASVPESLERAMRAARIELGGEALCVLLLADGQGGERPERAPQTARAIEEAAGPLERLYAAPLNDRAALAVVASFPEGGLAPLCERVLRAASRAAAWEPCLAAGQPCAQLSQLHNCLDQAHLALDYALAVGGGRIAHYGEVADWSRDADGRLPGCEQAFLAAIRQGDEGAALAALDELIDTIRHTRSYDFGRYVCFDAINRLISMNAELHAGVEAQALVEVMRFSHFEELREKLGGVAARMCAQVLARRESRGGEVLQEMLSYVEGDFRNPDMSLTLLAQRFHLSAKYVSRLFKEQTGRGFSDHLTALRLEYVKRQLAGSDLPVKEIILAAGYQDSANFIRKFKALEGVTPGNYRKVARADAEGE